MFHVRIMFTAIRALRQNLLRSMLATLGVVIGVGAVVSAISILKGTERDILDRVGTLGADQVMVFNGSERRQSRAVQVQSLQSSDAEQIERENSDLVRAVVPQFQGAGQITYGGRNAVTNVLGATDAYSTMNDYLVETGRFITREDVRGSSMVCVLGYKIARELFGPRSGVHETVRINGRSFIVVGEMEEKGTLGFTEVDSQVVIPVSTAMGRMFGSRYLTMLVVQCSDPRKLDACIERVKRSLRSAHRIKAGDDDDFVVFTQERMKQTFGQFSQVLAVVLYSIAGISLVVGGIGIMNIMLVSVTERTREIGVRIAVGARRFDILKQFLIEASVISLLGGSFGALFGWAVANLIGTYTRVLEIYTPPMSVVLALLMAVVVGIVSGIYPAVRASQLDPVEALRYE